MSIDRRGEIAEEFARKQREFEEKIAIGICVICNKIYRPKFFNQDLCNRCEKIIAVF